MWKVLREKYHLLVKRLLKNYTMILFTDCTAFMVIRNTVMMLLGQLDREGVAQRCSRRLHRRVYFSTVCDYIL